MSFRLKEEDCKSPVCLADHRMLTVTQLMTIFQKSAHVVTRRLRDLEKEGLVEVIGHELGSRTRAVVPPEWLGSVGDRSN
jgi:DNA-binding MarR family transcriptional regulator